MENIAQAIYPAPYAPQSDRKTLQVAKITQGIAKLRTSHAPCRHLAQEVAAHNPFARSVYNPGSVEERRANRQTPPCHPALKNLTTYLAHIKSLDTQELLRTRISLLFKAATKAGNKGTFTYTHAAKIAAGGQSLAYGAKMLRRLQRCGMGVRYDNWGKPTFDLHIYRHWAVADAIDARHQQVADDARIRATKRAKQSPAKRKSFFLQHIEIAGVLEPTREVFNLMGKIQSPSPPLPTCKPASMAAIGDVLTTFNLPPEVSEACEGAQERARQRREGKGEGDCLDKGEGGIADYFAARAATRAATKPEGLDAKMAAFDAWQTAQRARNARKVDAAPRAADQAAERPQPEAAFVPAADDAEQADTQWLYENVCSIMTLRMLNLQKTVACAYTRGEVRAAAASLVSRHPADCRIPLGLFIDAMRKMQSSVFEDARLRQDIRLAKHGWHDGLYKLAGRWPKAT